MDTVSESSMAVSMAALGGIAIVHYNNTTSDQYSIIRSAKSRSIPFASDPIVKSPYSFIDSSDDFASSPCVFVTRNGDSNSELLELVSSFLARNAVDWAPLVSGEDGEVVDVFSAEDVERIQGFLKLGLPSLGADGDFMVGTAMGTREEDKERLEHLVRVGGNVVVYNRLFLAIVKYLLGANFTFRLASLEEPLVKLRRKTTEAVFARRLLLRLYRLKQKHHRYQQMDTFLGEKIN
ncbi:hypothetical protein Syun_023455 [Stephania yunnanensis]|uniref:IMP dehydrogenase/GMP reductase domain-containing protein n=1 Tax=Stephania yunnanensis TaxID=152371 RepID=A0AAP0I3T4_9MAGN